MTYFAAAFAGASNLVMMRQKEIKEGIKIQDLNEKETYGMSRVAAKRAVSESAFTRFVLPTVLFGPAIMNFMLCSLKRMPQNNVVAKLLEASFCCISLTFALPMSIALFQQRSSIRPELLEEEFRSLKDKNGNPVDLVYYNKGM